MAHRLLPSLTPSCPALPPPAPQVRLSMPGSRGRYYATCFGFPPGGPKLEKQVGGGGRGRQFRSDGTLALWALCLQPHGISTAPACLLRPSRSPKPQVRCVVSSFCRTLVWNLAYYVRGSWPVPPPGSPAGGGGGAAGLGAGSDTPYASW